MNLRMVTAGLSRAPGGANTRNFHLLKALSNTYGVSLLVLANDAEINAVLFFTKKCWPIIQEQVPDTTWQIVRKNPPAGVKRCLTSKKSWQPKSLLCD